MSPEHPVSDPVETAAAGEQLSSSVAFDGTNYLVVWSDDRNSDSSSGNFADIYGARVTPSGAVLDPSGIPIATGAPTHSTPRVAFGGGTFLVVWSNPLGGGADVSGARVSPAGSVLDPSGIPISTAPGDQFQPAVAYGGGVFLVVWSDGRSGAADVFGAKVTPGGSVLDRSGIPISTAPGPQLQPAVAYGGGVFLVVWSDGRSGALDVFGAKVTPAGSVLDPSGIPISTATGDQDMPAVAFNSTNFLVVWEDNRSSSTAPDVFGAKVNPVGSVLDPSGITISAATGPQTNPAVAAQGSTFLVAWYDARSGTSFDVVGTRVDPAGTPLDPSGIVISAAAFGQLSTDSRVGLSSDGSNFFATWEDERFAGSRHIFATAVTTGGSVLGPGTLISRASNDQRSAAIGFDGTNYLVVWTDNRSGQGLNLFAARVSPAGTMLDPSDILVATGVGSSKPAVAFDGTNFLVVWATGSGAFAVRVSPSGFVFGPPVALPTQQITTAVAVAFNGSNYLVTWTESGLRTGISVRATLVSPAGSVLNPSGITITTSGSEPAVASDGTDFFVTWSAGSGVRGSEVSAGGTVLNPSGVAISTTPNPSFQSAIAWDGSRYFVVWTVQLPDHSFDIHGARVSSTGVVQPPGDIAISTAPGDQQEPVVAANGLFLVAWRDRGSGPSDDLYGARVGDDGTVKDTPGFIIAGSSSDERQGGLTAGPGGTWGYAYDRFVPTSPFGSSRVFLRTVAPK